MKSFLQKMSEKASTVLGDAAIRVNISEEKITSLLSQVTEEHEDEVLQTLRVTLEADLIRIQGKIKKIGVPISFSMDVKPSRAKERTLYFEVIDMKPLNQEWIKKKVLRREPFMTYEKDIIAVDINQFEKVKKIPVGTIKHFEVKEKQVTVAIGL